jgi:uncharacterized membrane protein (DUF4010 family)
VDQVSSLAENELVQVVVVIALTLVTGITREEKAASEHTTAVAGVRTFPIIGLLGYGLTLLYPDNALPVALGLAGLCGFLVTAYVHKLGEGKHGITTEMAALAAYLVGALVARDLMWIACSVSVACVMLLQSKAELESFAIRLAPHELGTFVQFLLLSVVILPVLPNANYTQFHINPFRTWVVVVAVSGISYASYVIQRAVQARRSVLLTALFGGAYSSTVTTVVLAKRSKVQPDPWLNGGAIILASGVMYLRLAILLWIFNRALGGILGPRLLALWAAGTVMGYAMSCVGGRRRTTTVMAEETTAHNPLEIGTAVLFAALFVGISVVTQLATQYLGRAGVYGLAAIIGMVDIDPFILSLTQTAGQSTPMLVAAVAVILASGSNNLLKGIYGFVFGERRAAITAFVGLIVLAAASFLTLIGL